MSSKQPRKQILTLGRTAKLSGDLFSPEQINRWLEIEFAKATEAGFDLTNLTLADTDESRHEFRNMLRSKHWDGVSVGYGVRGPPEYSAFFEEIVNTIIEEVKPPPKLIFAGRPDALAEAIQRPFANDN